MPEKLFLKPGPGRRVLDPVTGRPLPPEGLWVDLTDHRRRVFYGRRLKDGDVLATSRPSAATGKPSAGEKE